MFYVSQLAKLGQNNKLLTHQMCQYLRMTPPPDLSGLCQTSRMLAGWWS